MKKKKHQHPARVSVTDAPPHAKKKAGKPLATTVRFIKGILGTDPIVFSEQPQIAFVGRSNVGKSSAINAILGQGAVARSSATPGKTREINYFLVNTRW